MLSADIIKEIWEDIATRHITDVSFSTEINKVLDEDPTVAYPVCVFLGALPGTISEVSEVLMKGYTVSLMFLDHYGGADRTSETAHDTIARMDATASHCFARFHRDYIQRGDSTWQGEPISVEITSAPVLTQVIDDGTRHLSGVAMTFGIQSHFAMECTDTMFN